MRKIVKGLCVIGMLLLAALPALAQDATPTFIPTPFDPTMNQTPPVGAEVSLADLSFNNNICVADLIEANLDIIPIATLDLIQQMPRTQAMWVTVPANLVIPPHNDCYNIVKTTWLELPQTEVKYNICIEEFHYLTQGANDDSLIVYLPQNAPPCVNEAGQRLQYYEAEGLLYSAPIYSEVPFADGPAEIGQLGYCIRDLARINPFIYFGMPNPNDYGEIGYIPGMRVFLPEGTIGCDTIPATGDTLFEMSQQRNICMETLLATTGVKLMRFEETGIALQYPVTAAPCYDDLTGQRFGFKDREVYTPQLGESFLDIAQAHNVCLNDLWDANPVMEFWDGWWYILPDVVFIPDTAPCAQQQFTVRGNQTFHAVSLLTNTCLNRLYEANRDFERNWMNALPVGSTLNIPQRPHCYDLSDTQGGLKLQPHICYPVPVTAESDFTDHTPAISASLDTNLPYCYDRDYGMTVYDNNKPYTLYKVRGYESFLLLSQCFGVEPEAFYILNLYDRFNSAWSVTPGALNTTYQGPLLVPQPHADCGLLGVDDATHWQRYVEMTYKAGSLQNGIYTVNYGDTLSSIGRKYGYLAQSIAETNGLTDPTMIYYLQELKMPTSPSLYTLIPIGGAAGALVLAGGLFYGVRRWSRARGKSKKKNEAA